MSDIAIYDHDTDIKEVKDYILRHGRRTNVQRNEYIVRTGEASGNLILIRRGAFKCTRTDYRGRERIIALAFEDELMGNFLSTRMKVPSLFDIVAIEPSTVYALDLADHADFLMRCIDGGKYVRPFVEALAFNHLQKAVSLACRSPWEILDELQQRVPGVFQRINMKDIAAYIGVSPETLSRRLADT